MYQTNQSSFFPYSKTLSLIWIITSSHRRTLYIYTTNPQVLPIILLFPFHPIIYSALPDNLFLHVQFGFGYSHFYQSYHMQTTSDHSHSPSAIDNSLFLTTSSPCILPCFTKSSSLTTSTI